MCEEEAFTLNVDDWMGDLRYALSWWIARLRWKIKNCSFRGYVITAIAMTKKELLRGGQVEIVNYFVLANVHCYQRHVNDLRGE